MSVRVGKAVLWSGLTAAYHRPRAVLDLITHLTLGSPFVLPVYADKIINASQAELATRLALTILALTPAVVRTSSTGYLLVVVGFLVAVNLAAVFALSTSLSFPGLSWSPATQQGLVDVVATGSYALLLGVGYFSPRPEPIHSLRQKQYRAALVSFYATNNPSKLDSVDDLLRRYRFHEEVLFTRLKKKYLEADSAETVDDEESSDEDDDAAAERSAKQLPQVGTSVQHEDTEGEEEAGPFERADTTPTVQSAIADARAAQSSRVEERIRRMKQE
ncbi:hypothetical protein B5M09_001404 [Aphanomyces astaci]|nr:hypothetical protein B5M09_001404 [Aphanomyces astaci]